MQKQFKKLARNFLKSLPYFKAIYAQLDALEVPPGHFYSPIPSLEDIKTKEKLIFDNIAREIPGIELNEEHQLKLLKCFKSIMTNNHFLAIK
jgi:hypothetical protein